MVDNILIIIAVLSLLVIFILVFRKFSALASINIKAIPKYKHEEVKVDIIEERVNRRFKQLGALIKGIFLPLFKLLGKGFSSLYTKAQEWEEFYRKSSEKPRLNGEDIKSKISHLINEGEDLIKQEDYNEAEKKLIEVISLDKKNMKGFERLGEVYFLQKQYEQAVDTFKYILRLNPKEVMALCELGEISRTQGDRKKAISYFHKALDIEPNNPKCLALLIETGLEEGNKATVYKAIKKLIEVNPENQNLKEYRKKVKEL